jgi:hypothetical protein
MASAPSPLGLVLSTVNGYPNRSRPSGRACCSVFRVPVGYWGTPWGPPPHPAPAVHSDGMTALHWAAYHGNRRMIRSLVDAKAAVNAQNCNGCAVCACGESADECAGRVAAAVCRAGTRRCTMPRPEAIPHPSRSCCCAAPTGPSRPTTGTAALRRTAETEPATAARVQAHAEAMGGRLSEARAVRSGREPGALRPPPHRPRHPPCLAPHPSRSSLFRRMCRRCSPIQRAGRQPPTLHSVTSALAARLVVHDCTGGSKCRARRARAAASIGSARRARVHGTVPRRARGDRHEAHASARAARGTATSPFRPLSRQLNLVLQAEQQRQAFDEVRPPRRARRSAQWCQCV